MNESNVALTISKDIVEPIVKAKIEEAIIAAMGGGDTIIEKVIQKVFDQKVDENGKPSSYSSDKDRTWITWVVKEQIETATREAIKKMLEEKREIIKNQIIKLLSSKKGIENFASSLLDTALNTNLTSKYVTSISLVFDKQK
jgi:hypothetical protein